MGADTLSAFRVTCTYLCVPGDAGLVFERSELCVGSSVCVFHPQPFINQFADLMKRGGRNGFVSVAVLFA